VQVVPEVEDHVPCTCSLPLPVDAGIDTHEEPCGYARGHFVFPTKSRWVSSWGQE
jgi:hypothetical protein